MLRIVFLGCVNHGRLTGRHRNRRNLHLALVVAVHTTARLPRHREHDYVVIGIPIQKNPADLWMMQQIIVLDSAHERDHVLAELQAYALLVTVGSYLVVVEDTNSDGVPVFPGSVGPTAALRTFLPPPLGQSSELDLSRDAMGSRSIPEGVEARPLAPMLASTPLHGFLAFEPSTLTLINEIPLRTLFSNESPIDSDA